MKLTDRAIKSFKPGPKPYKRFDGGGLFLFVKPNGSKLWRFKYRLWGKEKLLTLGKYPETSLKDARARHLEARRFLAKGVDPGAARKAEKATLRAHTHNSFEVIAREWWVGWRKNMDPTHAQVVWRRLENNIFPWLGARPISEIGTQELLEHLRNLQEKRTAGVVNRVRIACDQVFRYAIQTERAEHNPAATLRGTLVSENYGHYAAVTDPVKLGELLRVLDGYDGQIQVACALRLLPLVFVRPGELRAARWQDIDLEAAQWGYTTTKTKTPHIVPLAKQAVAILRELQPVTGHGELVFPGPRSPSRPFSDNTLNAAMRRMGITKEEVTAHGFRATARTMLDEVLDYEPHIIEQQLAHVVKDPNGRAYNRTKHLPQRRKMMQHWADYLDQLKGVSDAR